MQMHFLHYTYIRTQLELAPWVTDGACNHGSVFTLLGQMGTPHSEPDMLFVLRVVKMIYYISVLATLFWFVLF